MSLENVHWLPDEPSEPGITMRFQQELVAAAHMYGESIELHDSGNTRWTGPGTPNQRKERKKAYEHAARLEQWATEKVLKVLVAWKATHSLSLDAILSIALATLEKTFSKTRSHYADGSVHNSVYSSTDGYDLYIAALEKYVGASSDVYSEYNKDPGLIEQEVLKASGKHIFPSHDPKHYGEVSGNIKAAVQEIAQLLRHWRNTNILDTRTFSVTFQALQKKYGVVVARDIYKQVLEKLFKELP